MSRPRSTAPRPKTVERPRPSTPRANVPRVERPERPGGKSAGPWNETAPPRGDGYVGYKPGGDGGSNVGGGRHGSGHGRHGHGHGRYYRPHYPYYYWGWSYWGYPYYYRPSYYFGLGYGWGYWGLGYGYYPSFYYYPHYPRYAYGRAVRYEPQGALDLNVKPKDTQVYLNGYFIGTTGDFDGWPNYLWLDEDSHELIFYKEGFETVVREIAVRPEVVLNIKFRMQPGRTVKPEELTRYKDREREEYAARDEREYRERRDRDPVYRERDRGWEPAPLPERPAEAPKPPAPPEGIDVRTEPGRLQVKISPAEASVYLDGRFVGIGGELSALTAGLLMDPGEHRLQVFHPDHEPREETFTVETGKETKLDIDLTR